MNNVILVDVDDTINDMTGNMCKAFDKNMERLTFQQILAGEVPEGFQKHRMIYLHELHNWGCSPAGVGARIIPMITANKHFKPVICTKVPTKVGTHAVASVKVAFQQKYYPNTDSLLVLGDKSAVAARGIIDDLKGNCLSHNKKHESAYLIFEHGRTSLQHLEMFMKMCEYEYKPGQDAALVVAKYHDTIIKFVRHNGEVALPCGKVEDGETFEQAARREFWEETGVELTEDYLDCYGTMTTKTGWKVGVYFVDLSYRDVVVFRQPEQFANEGEPIFCNDVFIGESGDENYEFNNILMHNLGLTPTIDL